jgi:hypothetical protein
MRPHERPGHVCGAAQGRTDHGIPDVNTHHLHAWAISELRGLEKHIRRDRFSRRLSAAIDAAVIEAGL